MEALNDAMQTCRDDWAPDFCQWITDLVDISLRSAVGVFEDEWYEQRKGIPTGGSLSVQLANITVFYVINKLIYNCPSMMKDIVGMKRFIDDGVGFYCGTKATSSSGWIL